MNYSFNTYLPDVSSSEIRRFFELAQQSDDAINFGVGEPDFDPHPLIREAAHHAIDAGYSHYSPNMGFPDLREAIAVKLREENGIPVVMENIMVTHGAAQALFTALFALLNKGDEVIIFEPAFSLYAAATEFCGGRAVAVPLDQNNGFHIDFTVLEKAFSDRTKGIIINTPHNPTGVVFTREELERLSLLAKRFDIWIISDEIYEKIIYDDHIHHSIASFPGMFERTITVNGFSKAFSITGWRLGYMGAPEIMLEQILKIQQNSVACANTIAQRAGLAALQNAGTICEESLTRYTALRDLFCGIIHIIPGIRCFKPQGTFYAVIETSGTGLGGSELALYLLNQFGIVVVPQTAFGKTCSNFIRFSFCIPEAKIREGLERFKNGIRALTEGRKK
jgi:aspartate aminotransferase